MRFLILGYRSTYIKSNNPCLVKAGVIAFNKYPVCKATFWVLLRRALLLRLPRALCLLPGLLPVLCLPLAL